MANIEIIDNFSDFIIDPMNFTFGISVLLNHHLLILMMLFFQCDMCAQNVLVSCDRPNMEIINWVDSSHQENSFSYFVSSNALRCAFHQNINAFFEHRNCCEDHKDREKVSANWIDYLEVWSYNYNNWCYNNSDWLQKITN